jgi:hypothetical protein
LQTTYRMTKHYSKKSSVGCYSSKIINETPVLWVTQQSLPVIYKEAPGKGFRHYLTKKDIVQFINLLPDWNRISKGLTKIVLAKGVVGSDGWYTGTVLAINAWERDALRWVPPEYYLEHKSIFENLDVECYKQGKEYLCKFDQYSIKAFQLLHVFLHELGHHHDKITTRRQKESSRGEAYAEEYAREIDDIVWDRYFESVKK